MQRTAGVPGPSACKGFSLWPFVLQDLTGYTIGPWLGGSLLCFKGRQQGRCPAALSLKRGQGQKSGTLSQVRPGLKRAPPVFRPSPYAAEHLTHSGRKEGRSCFFSEGPSKERRSPPPAGTQKAPSGLRIKLGLKTDLEGAGRTLHFSETGIVSGVNLAERDLCVSGVLSHRPCQHLPGEVFLSFV